MAVLRGKSGAATLFALALCLAWSTAVPADAVEEGARLSLAGEDFSAWRHNTGQWEVVGDTFMNPDNEKLLGSKPGTGVFVNGPTGRTTHLFSKEEFGDVNAHIEFMVPKGSNSGVYFMGRYEIQVFDSWGVDKPKYSDCGGIYQRWGNDRNPKGFEGHPPRVNASRPPGKWQAFDAVFRAPRFDSNGIKVADAKFEKVMHNGIVVHQDVDLSGPTRAAAYSNEKPTGPLMLQGDHGPVAYRNIWLAPADSWYFYAFGNAVRGKGLPVREQVTLLKELGYDGMEYSGCRGLEEVLNELDSQGLRLFALYIGVQLDPDKQSYNAQLKDAIRLLKGRDTVLALNVRGRRASRRSPEAEARAVEIIREIADMAADSKLRVVLYPHYGFWVERVEHAVQIVKKVKRDNVGVVFNLCHWLRAEGGKNLHSVLQMAKPYLFLVSINGADHSGGWDKLIQPLESGEYDVYPLLKALKQTGYTGPIGLQCYGIKTEPREHLARSMRAWRGFTGRLHGNID
jgi:sugar phosphate isomerase/epimerase